jgi:hypothetical protein
MRKIIPTCALFLALAGTAHAQNAQSIDTNTEVFTGLSFESNNHQPDSIDTTPGVYPPGMDAGTNSCANSVSGGASVTGFGFALGTTFNNEDCQDRNWYALTTSRNQMDVAKAYACLNNEKMRRALIASGTDCAKYEKRLASSIEDAEDIPQPHPAKPEYCNDGGLASASTIAKNCPNARQIIKDRGW